MKKICVIISLFLLLLSCDLDKFTGSKYQATPLLQTAKIYGKVNNIFTGEPVFNAQIKFQGQTTFSDTGGNYLIHYYLGEDEERNKPVSVEIKASKYLPFYDNKIIYPENNYDFLLEYGAPIILEVARVDSICQAIIFDYQGFDNIATAAAKFYYRRQGERLPSLISEIAMQGFQAVSSNIGYFQCIVDPSIPGYGDLINTYYVFAYDKNALGDTSSYAEAGSDSLLFKQYP